jgi:hypothetical protein
MQRVCVADAWLQMVHVVELARALWSQFSIVAYQLVLTIFRLLHVAFPPEQSGTLSKLNFQFRIISAQSKYLLAKPHQILGSFFRAEFQAYPGCIA